MEKLFFEADKENRRIEEALQNTAKKNYEKPHMSAEQLNRVKQKMEEAKLENRKEKRRKNMTRAMATAAAVLLAIIILPNTSASVAYAMQQIPFIGKIIEVVTIRDYQYEDDRHRADIDVTELKVEESLAPEGADEEAVNTLENTTEEINAEIQEITDRLIEEFEKSIAEEEGYQDVMVKSELLATTEDYFTLKLICFQAIGSGYEWNYYYTIDLHTGERLKLKELFTEGSDYITPISENIISQMREQMAADPEKIYWLDSDMEDSNFKQITDETSFYVNEKGNVVICFNEADVAPGYMGAVEFEIPNEAVANIRK